MQLLFLGHYHDLLLTHLSLLDLLVISKPAIPSIAYIKLTVIHILFKITKLTKKLLICKQYYRTENSTKIGIYVNIVLST